MRRQIHVFFLRETQSLEDIPSSSIDFIDALKQRIIVSWPEFNMIPWKPNFRVERRYNKIRERRKRDDLQRSGSQSVLDHVTSRSNSLDILQQHEIV
jgi:hypothetical protein